MTKQINELASYTDPTAWATNIDYDGSATQVSKILHQAKRYIYKNFPTQAKTIEETTKKTLYNSMKEMPLGNFVILLHTESADVMNEITKIFVDNTRIHDGRYTYVCIDSWVDKMEAAFKDIIDIRAAGAATGTPAEEEDTPKEVKKDFKLTVPEPGVQTVLDHILKSASLPPIKEIVEVFQENSRLAVEAGGLVEIATKAANEAQRILDIKSKEFEEQVRTLSAQLLSRPLEVTTVKGDGTIPNGTIIMRPAASVFGLPELTFDVPCWEWDGPHPDVPAIDPDYIFRPKELTRVLYAALTNQRAYLQGHTGTGKTTLIEQTAARLGQPFMCLNFDSEITRMDLIGRDVLTTSDTGETISKFVDGILPQAMSKPYWLCLDEIDFVRPDVAYVMQRTLEGNGIRITEDGGRYITPHGNFRMFATGNTVGQGDEMGMYQGARPQSLALLDRFTVWIKVDYLDKDQRKALIKARFPALLNSEVDIIGKYTEEHIQAFTNAKVLQPISPRGMMSLARAVTFFKTFGSKNPIGEALSSVVLDRASQQDYAVLKGIVDRIVK